MKNTKAKWMNRSLVVLLAIVMAFAAFANLFFGTRTETAESKIIHKLETLRKTRLQANSKLRNSYVNVAIEEYNLLPNSNLLTQEEAVLLATKEINKGIKQGNFYQPKQSHIVEDFSGNKYLFTSFLPYGSSFISLYNYETVEIDYFDENDYSSLSESEQYMYIPTAGLYTLKNDIYSNVINDHFFYANQTEKLEDNSSLYQEYLENNYEDSLTQKISVLSSGGEDNSVDKDWVVDISTKEVTADKEIPHSWFFKYNTTQFSYKSAGSSGICEYIAFLLIMEYHDFFSSAGYFSDLEIEEYVTTVRGNSFEEAIPNISDDFCEDLFELNDKNESITIFGLGSLSDKFMKDKTVDYKLHNAWWMFGNPKDVINKGRPDMICGMLPDTGNRGEIAHNVVAYGYFTSGTYEGKYLTHYGWNGKTQCIISRPFASGYDWSVENKSNHVCRKIFNVKGVLKCGCESD